jgi:hypothetical protein
MAPCERRGDDPAMPNSRTRLHARTFRTGNGAHLLSLASAHDACPNLEDALASVPRRSSVVVNLDGLETGEIQQALSALNESRRLREAGRPRVIVVSADPRVRHLFDLATGGRVVADESVSDALGRLVGDIWLGDATEPRCW